MKTVLLFSVVLTIVSAVRGQCDACFEQQCYTKHYLCGGNMVHATVNNLTNELYNDRRNDFIYFNIAVGDAKEVKYQLRRYSFTTKTTLDYAPWHLTDFAVGESYNDTYLIEYLNKEVYQWTISPYMLSPLKLPKLHYNKIEFKDKLYFSSTSEPGIFFYENKESKIVPGTENHYIVDFIVDKKNDIYFVTSIPTTEMKLWRLKSGLNQATEFSSSYMLLTLDKDGNAHFINTATHGAFRVDYETEQLYQVGAFQDSVSGIVFDKRNNIIYTSSNKLYQLKRESQPSNCIVTDNPTGKMVISQTSVTAENVYFKKSDETSTRKDDVLIERNNETATSKDDVLIDRNTVTPTSEEDVLIERNTVTPTHKDDVLIERNTVTPTQKDDVLIERNTVTPTQNDDVLIERNTVTPTQKHDVLIERNTVTPTQKDDVLIERNNSTATQENDQQNNNVSSETDVDIPTEDDSNLPSFLKRLLLTYQKETRCNCNCPKLTKISSTVVEFN